MRWLLVVVALLCAHDALAKNCKKGCPCGNTCIPCNRNCRLDDPPPPPSTPRVRKAPAPTSYSPAPAAPLPAEVPPTSTSAASGPDDRESAHAETLRIVAGSNVGDVDAGPSEMAAEFSTWKPTRSDAPAVVEEPSSPLPAREPSGCGHTEGVEAGLLPALLGLRNLSRRVRARE